MSDEKPSTRLFRKLREYSNGGIRDLRQIPLPERGSLTQLAGESYEELLVAARGKKVDSPEVRRLQAVSRMITGKWGDNEKQ